MNRVIILTVHVLRQQCKPIRLPFCHSTHSLIAGELLVLTTCLLAMFHLVNALLLRLLYRLSVCHTLEIE